MSPQERYEIRREQEIKGQHTVSPIEAQIKADAKEYGLTINCREMKSGAIEINGIDCGMPEVRAFARMYVQAGLAGELKIGEYSYRYNEFSTIPVGTSATVYLCKPSNEIAR